MKTFVVILAVAGLAAADIGLGYHYGPSKPQTSYGPPSYPATGGSGFNSGYTGQNTGSIFKGQTLSNVYQGSAGLQNGYPSQVLTSGAGYQGSGIEYQTGNTGYQSGSGYQAGTGYKSGSGYQSGTGYQSGNGYQTGAAGYQTSNHKYQTGGNYAGLSSSGAEYQSGGSLGAVGVSSGSIQGVQGASQYQSANQFQSNAVNYQQYYNQVQQQPAQIFKHFYVHAAPEEHEAPRARQPVVLPAPQKHYKIIFIKTPAPAVSSSQIIPVQTQNEEKTIVYVLVKKPEAAEDIVVPQIEQKPPSKPEVYFIKYKGKEDSQSVINNIVNEYNGGKESVNVVDAVHSSGTLDSISEAKYTSQTVGTSQSVGHVPEAAQVLTGSSGSQSQYETNVGSVGQSLSSGSFDSGSSGSGFQSSFGTSTVGYPSSTAGYQVSTAAPIQVNGNTGGYEIANSGVSSTASSEGGFGQVNTISSNQGIPHENYGPPKFRDN